MKPIPFQRKYPKEKHFVFPYSKDTENKKEEIWNNLQKGLLFEDTQTFIPWMEHLRVLNKIAIQKNNKGDRTMWYLGTHEILDGYKCNLEVMKWNHEIFSNRFLQIDVNLGFDYEGNDKFIFLKDKLITLLGEPTNIELEKFGSFDVGKIEWANRNIYIYLIGFEQFACKYRFHIKFKPDNILKRLFRI